MAASGAQGRENPLGNYFENILKDPNPDMDFQKGELLRVLNKDVDVLQRLHVAEACRWNPKMENFIGLVGRVARKTPEGHVRLAFYGLSPTSSIPFMTKWSWYPACLARVQGYRFSRKQHVYVTEDKALLLQENPSWQEELYNQLAGKLADIVECRPFERAVITNVRGIKNDAAHYDISADSLVPVYDAEILEDRSKSKQFRLQGRFGDPNIPPPYPLISGDSPSSDVASELLKKLEEGDCKFVLAFIRHYKKVDIIDEVSEESALMKAAYRGRNTILHVLCLSGANTKLKDSRGYTAVHHAVLGDQETAVSLLVYYGAPVNSFSNLDRWSPLHLAVELKRYGCFKVLVEARETNVNIQDSQGETPFHLCIENQCDDMLNCLLEKRMYVNPSIVNERGYNCLHLAALHGNTQAVDYIMKNYPLQYAVWKDAEGLTAFHLAAQYGRQEVVKTIATTRGTDMNGLSNGRTALHYVIDGWRKKNTCEPLERIYVVCGLVGHGADVNTCDGHSGSTPLHEAMKLLADSIGEIPPEIILELQGLDDKYMCIEELVERYQKFPELLLVLYLLLNGADLDAVDSLGKKPVNYFSRSSCRYIWNHFSEYRRRMLKDSGGSMCVEGAKCTKCGETADVSFEPCGHAVCCRNCAPAISLRFCAKCDTEIQRMRTTDGLDILAGQNRRGEERSNRAEDIENENRLLRRQLEEVENRTLCLVCMDRKCDMLFNCGHMVCKDCGSQDKMHCCPTCRMPIKKRHIVFPQW